MDQVKVFDHSGIWIEQLRTSAERAWTLVTESSARFYVSIHDPKCNPFVLKYGNLVLIEQSDGLPAWVGMIDRIGFERGAALVRAYSPERYFDYRRGPQSLTLTGKAGQIFQKMINYINGLESTVLAVGDINSDTNRMEETLNPVVLTRNLKRIIQRSGEGYRWRPVVERGKLIVYADWFPSLVIDNNLILQDGYNIAGDHPIESSAPINDYLAYGQGSDWETRLTAIAQDSESRQQYGLRQASESYNTLSQDTLQTAADVTLNELKQPSYSFPLAALNIDDTFKKLQPGVKATYTKLVGQGFSQNSIGYLSYEHVIKAMVFDPAVGTVSLAF
jgi:hypothetical protein